MTVFATLVFGVCLFGCNTPDAKTYGDDIGLVSSSRNECEDGKEINTWSKKTGAWAKSAESNIERAPNPSETRGSISEKKKGKGRKEQTLSFNKGCNGGAEVVVEGDGKVKHWKALRYREKIEGLFGAFSHFSGCVGGRCLGSPTRDDLDGDGVMDLSDRCFNTTSHVKVHRVGLYSGCGEGQVSDRSLAAHLKKEGFAPNDDYDEDGVLNKFDRCSNTARSVKVFEKGDWSGCSWGQRRDVDVLSHIANFAH